MLVIKQFMYSNGSEELHTIHNQLMSMISLFWMRQEKANQHKTSVTNSLLCNKYVISWVCV